MEDDNDKRELTDKICLLHASCKDMTDFRFALQGLLGKYNIQAAQLELIPYEGGKTEVMIKRFLIAKKVAGCSDRTLEFYTQEINRFFTRVSMDYDKVKPETVQAYLAEHMIRGISKVTCDNMRRCLSSFYGWLQKEEILLKNPMNKVENIKVEKRQKKALSSLEVEKLRVACTNNMQRAIVETLLSTGCRVSELVSIKLADIQGDKIRVIGKGDKERDVFLNAKAQVAIHEYMKERSDKSPYLFPKCACNIRDKRMPKGDDRQTWYKLPELVSETEKRDTGTIEATVRKLGRRAGVENVHPHKFRRTCATMALAHGMQLALVSKMLGHENIATTQIYLALDDKELQYEHSKYVV